MYLTFIGIGQSWSELVSYILVMASGVRPRCTKRFSPCWPQAFAKQWDGGMKALLEWRGPDLLYLVSFFLFYFFIYLVFTLYIHFHSNTRSDLSSTATSPSPALPSSHPAHHHLRLAHHSQFTFTSTTLITASSPSPSLRETSSFTIRP